MNPPTVSSASVSSNGSGCSPSGLVSVRCPLTVPYSADRWVCRTPVWMRLVNCTVQPATVDLDSPLMAARTSLLSSAKLSSTRDGAAGVSSIWTVTLVS